MRRHVACHSARSDTLSFASHLRDGQRHLRVLVQIPRPPNPVHLFVDTHLEVRHVLLEAMHSYMSYEAPPVFSVTTLTEYQRGYR